MTEEQSYKSGTRKRVDVLTVKELKEWFGVGRKLNYEIKQLEEARTEAFNLACGALQGTSGEKVKQSSSNGSERKFITYSDYAIEIDKRLKELNQYKTKMLTLIKDINNAAYRTLLTARYINNKTWEEIAQDMNYDIRWIYRLHGQALSECARIKK